VLVVWIAVEAILRLTTPAPILSGVMLAVALIGLAINCIVLLALGTHEHDDLNLAGARLHVIGDLLGSVGAVVAALVVRYLGWLAADPLVSLLVSGLIVASAWRLLRRSAHILLEGTPDDIVGDDVAATLVREVGQVEEVHHVHVWQLAGGRRVATLHARIADGADADAAIASVQRTLRERFRIVHATIQIESAACVGAGCHDHEPAPTEPHRH
jgi:cobalt-zinc-cadmium efflux system protein